MNIIPRAIWGARYGDGYAVAPVPAPHLILHHSATATLPAGAPQDAEEAQMRLLERIGEERFGSGMSYTFAVFPSGRVYQGVSIGRASAHTLGHNYDARAIVMVGNYDTAHPSALMLDSIADLTIHGHAAGWWRPNQIEGGHRDFERPGYTECPGDAGEASIRTINARISERITDVANSPEQLEDAAYAAVKRYDTERRKAGEPTPVEAWEMTDNIARAVQATAATVLNLQGIAQTVQTIVTSLASVESVEREHVEGIASQIAILQNEVTAIASKLGVEV